MPAGVCRSRPVRRRYWKCVAAASGGLGLSGADPQWTHGKTKLKKQHRKALKLAKVEAFTLYTLAYLAGHMFYSARSLTVANNPPISQT